MAAYHQRWIFVIGRRWHLAALILITILFPQKSLTSPAQPQILSGINYLYNYQFDEALAALDSVRFIDPDHPVQPFVRLAVRWLKAQTETGYEQSYLVIEKEVETLVPWYNARMEMYPNDPEYPLYLGSAYGMKARIALARRDWLGVVVSGYRGYRYVNLASIIDPDLPDIMMPVGLMEYYTGKMPGSIRWLAELFGINADTRSGLDKLEMAASSSYYSWIESSNVLVYAYLYMEKDFTRALKWVTPLTETFPKNPMFKLLEAEIWAKSGNWLAVDNVLPELVKISQNESPLLKNECEIKTLHILALKAYDKKNYQQVITLTTNIIENYQMEFDWLLGFAYLLRGKATELSGDRATAIIDYKKTASMDNKYPEVKEARKLISIPFTG